MKVLILGHHDDIKECFDATLEQKPEANGKIVLSWDFENGKVTTAKMISGPKELSMTAD